MSASRPGGRGHGMRIAISASKANRHYIALAAERRNHRPQMPSRSCLSTAQSSRPPAWPWPSPLDVAGSMASHVVATPYQNIEDALPAGVTDRPMITGSTQAATQHASMTPTLTQYSRPLNVKEAPPVTHGSARICLCRLAWAPEAFAGIKSRNARLRPTA